ncbi:hypothetical protein D0Z06_22530, partial [Geodermatophilus marinus]
ATATDSRTATSAAHTRPPPKTHDHEGVNFQPSLGGQLWAVVDREIVPDLPTVEMWLERQLTDRGARRVRK